MRTIAILGPVTIAAMLWGEDCPNQSLTLETAIQRTLNRSSGLQAAGRSVDMMAAERWQAQFWENPIFFAETEDIGSKCDDNTPSVSVGLEQLFEMGGKRNRRIDLAEAAQCMAWWEYEMSKQDKLQDMFLAFIEICGAQEKLKLAENELAVSEEVLNSINTKVNNGKASPLELKKEQIARNAAKLARNKAKVRIETAKRTLASMWGSFCPDFDSVEFPLFELKPLPPLEYYENLLDNAPELERARTSIMHACYAYALEEALAIPDCTLSAGVKQYTEPGCHSAFFGFSIPLPIANRNQGNILKARHAWCQSLDEYRSLQSELRNRIHKAYDALAMAYFEVNEIKENVLVIAEETFHIANVSYREGKFEYLNMLDSRKTLNTVEEQYLEAIMECHRQQIELMRLTGQIFSETNCEVYYD